MSKKTKFRLIVSLIVLAVLMVIGFVSAYFLGGNSGVYTRESLYDYDSSSKLAESTSSSGFSFFDSEERKVVSDDDVILAAPQETPGGTAAVDRLIIKTGSVSMVVSDVRAAIKAISDYATAKGGFVVSSNVSKYDVAVSGDVTIRIPSTVFEQGVSDVKAMGEVQSESVYGQDVTEEYVDLDAQLTNLRATEAQFLEIMKKAVKIEDVLAVQRELSAVRSEIERITGRMKYLQESASFSTLSVYLSTDPLSLPAVDDDTWKPFAVVKEALRSLVGEAQDLVDVLIWVVIYIPIWGFFVLVIYGIYRLYKKIWG